MDQRNLNEIHVTWQLTVFIICIATLAIPLGIIYGESSQDEWMGRPVVKISAAIAAGSLAMMALAVWTRVRQSRHERLPDGRPKATWILRQVAMGSALCVFGALIIIVLLSLEVNHSIVLGASCAAIAPGILLIGRVLAPPKPEAQSAWRR